MVSKLIDRNYVYWEKLNHFIKNYVVKLSVKFEELQDWKYDYPLIEPMLPLDHETERACIGKLKDKENYGLLISTGFIFWLDDAAEWMNKDVMFKKSLYLSTIKKKSDLSLWMHANWLNWVVSHEIGHLVCGHLSNENNFEWNEFNSIQNNSNKNSKLTIALEYDADIYAATIFFGSIEIILKTKEMRQIKEKYFFDIGMIFTGMFMALEHLTPSPKTHPRAIERFMVFMLRGLAVYSLVVKRDVSKEYEAFLNGSMKCIALLGEDGIKYAEKFKTFDIQQLKESITLLKDKNIHKNRFIKIENDWLTSKLHPLYFPSKEIIKWDLNNYPDKLGK